MLVQKKWELTGTLLEFAMEGKMDLVRSILDAFLIDTQEKIEVLEHAVLQPDLSSAQQLAHSLKGAARQLGIMQLADDAERLERSSANAGAAAFSVLVRAL